MHPSSRGRQLGPWTRAVNSVIVETGLNSAFANLCVVGFYHSALSLNSELTCAGGPPQCLPPHLPSFHQHYSGLYNEMYGHHQQQQQQGPVTTPPSAPVPPRGFFAPDMPVSHHPSLPRIDNSVLTYLNDVTASSNNGQSFSSPIVAHINVSK